MSFLYPNILWFLLLIPVLATLAVLAWRSTGQGWRKLVSAQHGELVKPRPLWRTALPASIVLLAMACIILALARPINGYREGGATTTGRNLLIALDISRSMETEDVKPSRLAEAKAAAYELIDALPGDKIGLIVFSGEADLVVPLTYDHTALRDALEQVNRTWAGVGGTNFGLVLRKAMQDFKRSTPEGSTNALVILSDGEDTVNSSMEIAEEARESKLLVITVGIGTAAGGAIPDAKGENGLWQDANGKHVISKLNTESLTNFAKATGGDYFVMDSNANLTAFTQAAVRKIDKHEEAFSLNKVPNDLFAPFATAALILIILAIIFSTEWKYHKSLALIAAIGGMTPHAHAAPQAENAAAYSQGLALMHSGEQNKAKEAFSAALLDKDTTLQAAALYQLGQINATATFNELRNLYENTQDTGISDEQEAPAITPEALQKIVDNLKQDIQPYQDALKLAPGLERAQKNIAGIQKLIKKLEEEIEKLKQQQQQTSDQQQDKQDQQNKDSDQQQDKQDQQNKESDQQQDKQDQQNKESDQQQDKQDQQNKESDQQQDKQNQQNKESDQQQDKQDQQNKESDQQQDKQDQQNKDSDQQQDQQDTKKQPAGMEEQQPSDEEKARRYAASVLRSHLEEEEGSPIPHAEIQVRPPDKDY